MTEFKEGDEVWVRAVIDERFLSDGHLHYAVLLQRDDEAGADSASVRAIDVLAAPTALSDHDRAVVEAAKAVRPIWARTEVDDYPELVAFIRAVDAAIEAERPKTAEAVIEHAVVEFMDMEGPNNPPRGAGGLIADALRSNPEALRQLLKEAEEK